MKRVVTSIWLWLIAAGPLLAADSISEAFQKGLFEEEANHDLPAAIKAYQSTLDQTTEHRKLAAAALFRLGECYRKLNKTNEAVVQYRRLIRDFADQSEWATLGKQNLSALGEASELSRPALTPPADDPELKELNHLKVLAKENPDLLTAADEQGQTPLHRAADRGFLKVTEFLLAQRADVNVLNRIQGTPLHYAVFSGETSMARLLLKNGANVNALGSFEYETPAKTNRIIGGRPLHIAAVRGHNAIAELLLQQNADVNGTDNAGRTPLHTAIEHGFLGFVRLLLTKGAEVNAANNLGTTPAGLAVDLGYESILRTLIESGANLKVRSPHGGDTLLHYAARRRSPGVLKTLLEHKPDLDAQNDVFQETPIYVAIQSQNPAAVELLLQAGADPNARNKKSSFPLFAAVDASNKEAVRLLLAAKADPNQTNAIGMTARNQAVTRSLESHHRATDKHNLREIAALLRQAGGEGDRTASIGIARSEHEVIHGKFLRQDAWQLNRFTLFELLCYIYEPPPDRWLIAGSSAKDALRFPDFAKIRIDRLADGRAGRRKIELNLETALASGDCAKDIPLEWGDIIEIPEIAHQPNDYWHGLPNEIKQTFGKCLPRDITVTVRGETKPIHLYLQHIPLLHPLTPLGSRTPGSTSGSFRLKEVISDFTRSYHIPIDPKQVLERVQQGLGFSRPSLGDLVDLTQVIVIRKSPETGEDWKVTLDAEGRSGIDDLHLRNGDAVYLPDKR